MKIVRVRDRRRTVQGRKRPWMYVMSGEPKIAINRSRRIALVMPEVDAQLLVDRLRFLSPGHEVEAIRSGAER